MQEKPVFIALEEEIEKDFNVFEENKYNLFFIKAVAGSGKTYNIMQTLRYFYGKYITKNKMQEYHQEDGSITYVPAGEGNLAQEEYKKFMLKTLNREDLIWANREYRAIAIAYNTDIKKELNKRMKNDIVLREVYENNLLAKTSHGLLFKYAEKLGMFEKKGEGEYGKGNMRVNFAKGDFTLKDALMAIDVLKNNSPFFKQAYKELKGKEKFELAKILFESVNIYYNSDIVIKRADDLAKLVELSQKVIEKNIPEILIKKFTKEQIDMLREKSGLEPHLAVLKYLIQSFKKGVNEGLIELGHSYYYKEVFLECMKDENKLLELFSLNHNPEKYFNIVIVDEAQDLTPIMTRLIIEYYKLAKRRGLEVATLIVGDEKQAIYQFANRINSFDVIQKELGEHNIKNYILNKTYRVPKLIANFTNDVCKKIGIYEEETALVSARKDEGFIAQEYIPLPQVVKEAIEEDRQLMVLGRTNAEILVNFLKTYMELKQDKDFENKLKYMKVDSKLKKEFKNLLTKGIEAINDQELLDKIKITLGKEKISFSDLKTEEVDEFLPEYLKKFIELIEEYPKEELLEILEKRGSTKPNVRFMTMHASKGLEAPNVYLLSGNIGIFKEKDKEIKPTGVIDLKEFESFVKGLSGKAQENIKEAKENEKLMEKYLLYVAITRTKHSLYLDKEYYEVFRNELLKNPFKLKQAKNVKI